MPDMIPASKVATAALEQVRQAAECFPTSYHETDKAAKGKVHLQVATELLGLIAEPSQMANVAEDGTMTMVGDGFYDLPLPDGFQRADGYVLIAPDLAQAAVYHPRHGKLFALARRVITETGRVIKSADGEQDQPPQPAPMPHGGSSEL